ncbi:hypothetical protein [Candidatus Leptofilum sp.]|uniref:hypothetical protein n=1 Tax=Candidatus Leptofilum sp. TaxID=3241576 RepID=UPI003B5B72E0
MAIRIEDPFLEEAKWPGCRIESHEFGKKENCDRLFELSTAYLKSAKLLCIEIGENSSAQNWPNASVVYFLLYHATELFLKACIISNNSNYKLNHDIGKLKAQYLEIYSNEDFNFPSPWELSQEKIEDIIGSKVFDGVDRNPDQKYRYFSDKKGDPPKSINVFSPGYILNYIEFLLEKWDQLWSSIVMKD